MLKVQGYNILPFPYVSHYVQKVGREFQFLYIFELYLNKLNIFSNIWRNLVYWELCSNEDVVHTLFIFHSKFELSFNFGALKRHNYNEKLIPISVYFYHIERNE